MLERLAVLALACCLAGCGQGGKRPTLAVVGKSAGGEYWLSVRHGAEAAARESDAKVIYLGPSSEEDVAGQIDAVQKIIQLKVDGLAISPVDGEALGPVVKQAIAAGIKVVTIDSDTVAHDRLCYIGTNNEEAGEVAGREMLKLVGPGHEVATITGPTGARNLAQRVAGFNKAVGGQLKLDAATSDGGNMDRAMAAAQREIAAKPAIAGFFSTTAIGGPAIAQAVESAGKAGSIKVISFDTTSTLVQQLKDGNVQVLIAQQPEKMGALGVQTLLRALKGDKLPPVIDTGVVAVTRENVALYDH